MVLCWSAAWFTQTLTVSSLLGTIVLGLFGVPRIGTFCKDIEEALSPLVVGIFLPVFFALVGLRTDWTLLDAHSVGLAFLLLGALFATRLIGGNISSSLFLLFIFKNIYFVALISCKGLTVISAVRPLQL